jgi:hypothetical protein
VSKLLLHSNAMGSSIKLCAIVHFAMFAVLVAVTAITAPISDMFTYIDVFLQFRAGRESVLDYLWQAHGEHHLVWMRLLTWIDVDIFHTQGIPFIIAATAALISAAFWFWSDLVRLAPNMEASAYLALLAPMLILSAANATDGSVPINATYPITVFFAVAAQSLFLRSLQSNRRAASWQGLGAGGCAFGASAATAAGLLVLPMLLWIGWREKLNFRWLIAIAVVGTLYTIVYTRDLNFLGLVPLRGQDASDYISQTHLHRLSEYFLSFLGLPFTRQPGLEGVGRGIGAIMLVASCYVFLVASFSERLNWPTDRLAVGLILLGLGSAVLATVGRSELEEGVKVPVRYTIFVSALQVGLFYILLPRALQYVEGARGRLALDSTCLVFAMLLLIMQLFIGISARRIATTIASQADCFLQNPQQRPVSSTVSRWPSDAEKVVIALREEGLVAPRSADCTRP